MPNVNSIGDLGLRQTTKCSTLKNCIVIDFELTLQFFYNVICKQDYTIHHKNVAFLTYNSHISVLILAEMAFTVNNVKALKTSRGLSCATPNQ